MGGSEIVYILAGLLVWGGIIAAIAYVVLQVRRRSAERDARLRSIEEKLDRLLDDRRP